MRRIYSQAIRVFIHLGDATDSTKAGIALANSIWLYREALRKGDPAATSNKPTLPWDSDTQFQRKGLGELLSRPWFRRMWIIQEVAACEHRIFMCWSRSGGGIFFEWPLIEAAVNSGAADYFLVVRRVQICENQWHESFDTIKNFFSALQGTITNVEARSPLAFLELLIRSKAFEATNECDKLYAILELARDAEDFLEVDYSKSWRHVFQRFANALVQQGHTRYLFNNAGLRNSNIDLPTWVPDWRHPPYSSIFDEISPYEKKIADGIDGQVVTEGSDGMTLLVVPAAIVCEISKVAPPMVPPFSSQAVIKILEQTTALVEALYETQDGSEQSPLTPTQHEGFSNPGADHSMIRFHTKALAVLFVLLVLEGASHWEYTGKEFFYMMECIKHISREHNFLGLYEPHARTTANAFGARGTFETVMRQYPRALSTPNLEKTTSYVMDTSKGTVEIPFVRNDEENEEMPSATEGVSDSDDDVKGAMKYSIFEKYWNAVFSNYYCRRVFVTESGLVGLGPDVAEPGDVVAMIPGSSIPYILHPVHYLNSSSDNDGDNLKDSNEILTYQLVGDAWVSGIKNIIQNPRIKGIILV